VVICAGLVWRCVRPDYEPCRCLVNQTTSDLPAHQLSSVSRRFRQFAQLDCSQWHGGARVKYFLLILSMSPLHHLHTHPTTPPDFSSFTPASESEILKILSNCPNKQSDSDLIPTWLLKECTSVLVPAITNIVNFSLTFGQFHLILKESVIAPLLKKSTLDKDELSNYRSIHKKYHAFAFFISLLPLTTTF